MKNILLVLSILIIPAVTMAQTDITTLTKAGSKCPSFTCKTIDGNTFDVSKSQGKVVLLNFFATWCGPCNTELPILQKNIWERYKDRPDFDLVIIGRAHTEAEVKAFVEKKKFKMPFAPDPDRKIFGLFATQNIPRNVIIGKDGKILFQSMGYSEEEFKKMETILEQQLK